MNWIETKVELPKLIGNYIIETKTMMGNIHRLETRFNGEKFDVSNQVVLRWLKD